MKKLVNVNEIASMLDVPKSWIYQRTRLGPDVIPHIKVGKYVRFDPDEVITFLNQKNNSRRVI